MKTHIRTPMTLIQRVSDVKAEKMESISKEDGKSLRPVRNRRYTRLVKMSHYFQSLLFNCLCASFMKWGVFMSFCWNIESTGVNVLFFFIQWNVYQLNKKHNTIATSLLYRRCLVAGQRPQKRLFTPEIKRYLKDWLVRRRDNPYPNREEKKHLSRETGLTYIQVSAK